jgi:hypothetical protein
MTVSAIPYVIIALLITGVIMIVCGVLLDSLIQTDHSLFNDPTLPYSQERAQTWNTITLCFRAMGVVALLTACIFLYMNANQSVSGEI